MAHIAFPASVVPAGFVVTFDSLRPEYVTGDVVIDNATYDFEMASDRSFMTLTRNGRTIRKDHKVALRAVILAAYAYAIRGVDMSAQSDAHAALYVERSTSDDFATPIPFAAQREVYNAAEADDPDSMLPGFYSYPRGDYSDDAKQGPFAIYEDACRGYPVPAPAPARPAAKPARMIVRSFAGLAAMLSLAAVVTPVSADPINAPLPSNAELHMAALRPSPTAISHKPNPFQPVALPPVAARVKAFQRGLHYEGHGEWNCAEAVCDRLLKANHLTWRQVRDVWTGRAVPLPPKHSDAMAVRFAATVAP